MNVTARPELALCARAQRSRGAGRLSAVVVEGRTRLGTLYQQGCAKLRVPAAHGGSGLEAVMINTSGGMTGGDRLEWAFEAGPDAELNVTTQACEKIYKSAGGAAEVDIVLKAGAGGKLAWLPQETILFDNSAYRRTITADLDSTASAFLVEAMVFGRHSMGEVVRAGDIHDNWRIRRNGTLIHAEALTIRGEVEQVLSKKAVGGGCRAVATLLLVSPDADAHLAEARHLIAGHGGASFWNGKLLARLVTADGYHLRQLLIPLIGVLNPAAALPKAWAL